MSENSKNIHRHPSGGIMFASILLIIIALISMIITFSALRSKGPAPAPDNGAENGGNVNDGGENDPSGENESPDNTQGGDNQNTPPKNTVVTVKSSDIFKGPLLQIDADHPYNRPTEDLIPPSEMENMSPGDVLIKYNFVNMANRSDGFFKPRIRRLFLDTAAADAFYSMMKAYNEETGISYIQLTYAYVNRGLYDIKSTGFSVDLNIYDGGKTYPLYSLVSKYNTPQHYSWFINNCHKYGFIHVKDGTGSDNFSTFRYIGIPHATYMKSNLLTLDSYLDLVRTKTPDNRLVTMDENGNEWWVYYVPAGEAETTDVKVFGNQYTISGDNVGGFIVSVNTAGIK